MEKTDKKQIMKPRKFTEKEIELALKQHKDRLESQKAEYPDDFDLYQSTIEILIFEMGSILGEDSDHLYSAGEIVDYLKGKLNDLESFDRALEKCGK